MEHDTEICPICRESLQDENPIVTLREKGSDGINNASEQRNDSVRTVPGQKVHVECRRTYCNPHKIAQAKKDTVSPEKVGEKCQLRSGDTSFCFATDCFYCATPVNADNLKKKGVDFFPVTAVETKGKVLEICSERNDAWAANVKTRILSVHDLPAADAVYHQPCSVNFRTGKNIPKKFLMPILRNDTDQPARKKIKSGRPTDKGKFDAFLQVAEHLAQNDDEQVTVNDLIEKMSEYLEGSDISAYSHPTMKSKLEEHFGNDIIITEINGKQNVVTFRSTAESVLQKFHYRQKENPEQEKKNIIEAAAKLIRNDIKCVETLNTHYSSSDEFESETQSLKFLPESLQTLLSGIITGKDTGVKRASIGQAIMQATRPRVLLAPLQVGLAVQMHYHFASRFLIDTLHELGFCSSYYETQKFGQNAAVDEGTDIPEHNSEFIQYVADNVDHDIRTLDGNDTFQSDEVSKLGHIEIQYHQIENSGIVNNDRLACIYK